MFKKSLATALLVCSIPALANAAWFLTTQVTSAGGTLASSNGTQSVTDGIITKSYTAIAVQNLTTTPDANSTLRGVTIKDTSTAGTNTITAPFTPVDGHTYYVQAAFKADFLSIKAGNTGGTVTPTSLGNIYKGYKVTSPIVFTFSPKSGYAITAINGVPSGISADVPGTVNARATVTFPKDYVFSADLDLEAVAENVTSGLNPILAQTVAYGQTAAITPTVNNIANPTYTWEYVSGPANTESVRNVNGKVYVDVMPGPAVSITPDGNGKWTFTAPSTAGQYKFRVKVGAESTMATVNVVATTAEASTLCQSCHTASKVADAAIGTKWSASSHVTNSATSSCSSCHVGSNTGGHPGQVSGINTCSSCHTPYGDKFKGTKHWVNSKEYGPEFTGGAIIGEINPNESWTTYEFGSLTTCAYRCHFKPGMGPDPNLKSTGGLTWTDTQNGITHSRYGGNGCDACHDPHSVNALSYQDTCLTCHSGSKHGKVPNEFFASKHWQNHFETGPEFDNQMDTVVNGGSIKFTGTTSAGYLNANDSYTTRENGGAVTCAYRCHFRPGMGPNKNVANYLTNGKATTYVSYNDSLNGVTYTRPGGDACIACHDSHDLKATYQTCLTCHTGSKHGKVPNEFFGSKHWQNHFEYGNEFEGQLDSTVQQGNVKLDGTVNGILNANDSYQTKEDGSTVTCAYRCHFRPGMYPDGVTPPANYVANRKAITYVMYSSPYGAGKFTRPGGDACLACHDSHGLDATARSTCYTCHAGGNHGWSVKAFEKSSHFTGQYAIAEGMGGPNGKACTQCHDAHSTEASFFAYSSASTFNAAVEGSVGCQSCHTPGAPYSIYDANRVGKAPHFQTGTPIPYVGEPDANGVYKTGLSGYLYATGAYMAPDSTRTCGDCHFHDNTKNKGWAEGSHGSVTSIPLVPSQSDNWNNGVSRVDYTKSAQVSDCIRCHTAKGFARFWDSGFKNVSGNSKVGTSGAPIACDACHNGPKATVRTMANVATYVGYSNATYSTKKSVTSMNFTNYKNSSVCIPCHAGRGTGALIKEVFKTPTATGYMIGTRIYAHFASAAGVVNGSSAYQFSTPKGNSHSLIGTNKLYGTNSDTQGPCVGCHMTTKKDAQGSDMTHSVETIDFTAGAFKTDVCQNCHGTDFTVDQVAESKAQFNSALNVLRNLLLQKGIDALQDEIKSRPGERKGQDMRGNAESQAAYAALGLDPIFVAERNTGAAFNWWLFGTSSTGVKQGDAAGYVHNPDYARQVIMDSIDWMDDYQLNDSAKTTILNMVGKPQPVFNDGTGTDGVIIDQDTADKAAAFAAPASNSHTAPAANTYKVQYLAGSSNCVTCHNPAETALQKEARTAWAESAHGSVAGLAWMPASNHLWTSSGSSADFSTTIPASDCVRCHTADGFKQFASGSKPFANVKVLAGDGKTNSPLNCQGCHTSPLTNDSARLAVPQVTTFFNISTVDKVSGKTVKSRIQAQFPDVQASNQCIACHAGRVNGPNLTELATSSDNWSLNNASFQNSHYMAASGVMYMKSGFINFTTLTAPTPSSKDGQPLKLSTKSYAKTLLPDNASTPGGISGGQTSVHRMIGTVELGSGEEGAADGETPYLGRGTDPAQRPLAQGGPCVNCHIQAFNPDKGNAAAADNPDHLELYSGDVPAKRAGAGHSLSALNDDAVKQICLPCHAHTKGLNFENFMQYKVNPAKVPYADTNELIKKVLLKNYQISYDPASYPYFYDEALPLKDGKKQAVTDWTRVNTLTQTQAYRLQGACFNLNLLARDKGGYVHGRTYTQRLQYDTIDYLDDLQMNFSALNTARTEYPQKFYGNNANTGYTVDLTKNPVASEGILWLSGTHPNNNEIEPPDNSSVLPIKLRP